jgi:hypothetical protein
MADPRRPRLKGLTFNVEGFEQVRRSPEVEKELQAIVDEVMAQVQGDDREYAGGVEDGRTRSRGYVVTANFEAIKDEAHKNLLLRALGGVHRG